MSSQLSFNAAMRERARAWVAGWQHADRIAFTPPYTYHAVDDELAPTNQVLFGEFLEGLLCRVFGSPAEIYRLEVRLEQLGELA